MASQMAKEINASITANKKSAPHKSATSEEWKKIQAGLFADSFCSDSDEGASSSEEQEEEDHQRAHKKRRTKNKQPAPEPLSENHHEEEPALPEKSQGSKKQRKSSPMPQAEGADDEDVTYRGLGAEGKPKRKRPGKAQAKTLNKAAMQQGLHKLVSEFCASVITAGSGDDMLEKSGDELARLQAENFWQYLKFPTAKSLPLNLHPLFKCPARITTNDKVWAWLCSEKAEGCTNALTVLTYLYQMLCDPALKVPGYATHVAPPGEKGKTAVPVPFFAPTVSD